MCCWVQLGMLALHTKKKSLGVVTLYELLDKSCYGRGIRDSKSVGIVIKVHKLLKIIGVKVSFLYIYIKDI